jgi:hypothetical protein
MIPGLTIVVATTGRPTLAKTLDGIAKYMPTAEVILAYDGGKNFSDRVVQDFATRIPNMFYHISEPPYKDYGGGVKQEAMAYATREFISFLDDDDLPFPAYSSVYEIAARQPDKIHIFRMRRRKPFFDVLWKTPALMCGNVSTQMFVVPNVQERLGKWTNAYEADFHFISETAKNFSVAWHQEVIAMWNGGRDE